jgi:hypothetical protein
LNILDFITSIFDFTGSYVILGIIVVLVALGAYNFIKDFLPW